MSEVEKGWNDLGVWQDRTCNIFVRMFRRGYQSVKISALSVLLFPR